MTTSIRSLCELVSELNRKQSSIRYAKRFRFFHGLFRYHGRPPRPFFVACPQNFLSNTVYRRRHIYDYDIAASTTDNSVLSLFRLDFQHGPRTEILVATTVLYCTIVNTVLVRVYENKYSIFVQIRSFSHVWQHQSKRSSVILCTCKFVFLSKFVFKRVWKNKKNTCIIIIIQKRNIMLVTKKKKNKTKSIYLLDVHYDII